MDSVLRQVRKCLSEVDDHWFIHPTRSVFELQCAQHWDTLLSAKIRHLVFGNNRTSLMALCLPYKSHFEHDIKYKFTFVYKNHAALDRILSTNDSTNRYKWIFGTNDGQLRKDIVESLNFDYQLYLVHKNKIVQYIVPHLSYIVDLAEAVHDFAMVKPHRFVLPDVGELASAQDLYISAQYGGVWWCGQCCKMAHHRLCSLTKATLHTFTKHIAAKHGNQHS